MSCKYDVALLLYDDSVYSSLAYLLDFLMDRLPC
jgi:hypothetical protein